MNAVVTKWGNSLGLRIPRGYAEALSLGVRSTVEMTVEDGALIIRPVAPSRRRDLDELVAGITDENLHSETATGMSVANEF
jgi:antitoxin MazE